MGHAGAIVGGEDDKLLEVTSIHDRPPWYVRVIRYWCHDSGASESDK